VWVERILTQMEGVGVILNSKDVMLCAPSLSGSLSRIGSLSQSQQEQPPFRGEAYFM